MSICAMPIGRGTRSSWTHVWKPMLHTFAAGTSSVHQQQLHYLLHARTHDFEYVPGRLEAIDRTAKRVRLASMHGVGAAIVSYRDAVARVAPSVVTVSAAHAVNSPLVKIVGSDAEADIVRSGRRTTVHLQAASPPAQRRSDGR